jgi:hypothetical protein
MATIVTRAGKGSPLTFAEVDANFTNLNNAKLELPSGSAVSAGKVLGRNTASGTGQVQELPIAVDASGNVGIGTSSLTARLSVQGPDGELIALIRGATNGLRFGSGPSFSIIDGVDGTGVGSYQPLVLNGSDLRLATSGVERMRFAASGNVGVGTTTPTANLDVNGTIKFSTLSSGTVSAGAVTATGSTTARTLANRFADVVNVKDFGAVGDGVTDDTAAITAANTAASAVGAVLEFPAGKYLFTGSIEVQKVTWRGTDVSRRNVSSYLNDVGGAVILLTNTTDSPFLMTEGGGAMFDGLTFFWPNQDGTTVTPVTYPALIAGQSGQAFIDLTLRDCFIINAYDVLSTGGSNKIGAVRIIDCKIYAIRSLIRLLVGAPDVIRIQGCDISVGQYQNVAVFANGAKLRNWTGANGALIYMDVGSSAYTSVDGLHIIDNLIFGYRRVIDVVSGRLDLPYIGGNHFDGCGTALRMSGSSGITGARFDNVYYFYQNDGSGATTIGFDISTTGIVRGDFGGTCVYCAGSYFVVVGSQVDLISLRGIVYAWGQGTAQVGDAYAVFINAPTGTININGSFRGQYADSIGVFVADGRAVSISGSFDNTKTPILIDTTFTGRWIASGVTTATTSAGNSIDCRAAGTGQALACFLDKAPTGTTPKFGSFTSNADAAVNGYVTIIDEAGNTRKLATIA